MWTMGEMGRGLGAKPYDNYWHDYIQTPIFPNDSYGMEGFSQIRLDEYTETKLHIPHGQPLPTEHFHIQH